MYVAPIGAFGAIAFTVGRFGPSSLLALGNLVLMFYVLCALFVADWCCGPLRGDSGSTCRGLIRYIGAELMIVVGTSSSESVFPRLHAKLRQLGVDPPIVSLGAARPGTRFNHDGTCLYFASVAVFLAQAVGIHLSIGQQLGLLAILLATSKGRRRRSRFGHRRPRIDAGRDGDDSGRERRTHSRRAPAAVIGVRAGQRARQRDCDARDRPDGKGDRCADVRIRASSSGRGRGTAWWRSHGADRRFQTSGWPCESATTNGGEGMVIDCHGHYTTVPQEVQAFRDAQIAGLQARRGTNADLRSATIRSERACSRSSRSRPRAGAI